MPNTLEPLRVAMPIAHVTGANTYNAWYDSGGNCKIEVAGYFNQLGVRGISLRASAAGAAAKSDLFNLFALTSGYLSYQKESNRHSLVLRLPRELNNKEVANFASGNHFLGLRPAGPQLRHVVYQFAIEPSEALVEAWFRALFERPAGPVSAITTYKYKSDQALPNMVDLLVPRFLDGQIEFFVDAGEVIGNFQDYGIEISFFDSSGARMATNGPNKVAPPGGRPLNPSYYLYLLRSPLNTLPASNGQKPKVALLTRTELLPAHPLDVLFESIPQTGNPDQKFEPNAPHPPKPLQMTVKVLSVQGGEAAGRGIPLGELANWHESRNASNPFDTKAPVQWRNRGAFDTAAADVGKFETKVKQGKIDLLPDGSQFDHAHTPVAPSGNPALISHIETARSYWDRYHQIFNLVADVFEIPCEILVAIACQETRIWHKKGIDTDVIRMEPKKVDAAANLPAADQILLNIYSQIAGTKGANAYIPIPWNSAAKVVSSKTLTWGELNRIAATYPTTVSVSPGVMQTLVSTAAEDLAWLISVYGEAAFENLQFVDPLKNVVIHADLPPSNRAELFSRWFGVAVSESGENVVDTSTVANEHLSRTKRAFHDIIAGAAHIKSVYNGVRGKGNLICDFDLPTVASGYNDGANRANAANQDSSPEEKWKRLFCLRVYSADYYQNTPKYFNAVVELFNTAVTGTPPQGFVNPSVRLWLG